MSQRQAEVTGEGRRKEVNTPDKSVLMDEFTFPMRKRESAHMPQRILVIRTERTSARVEEIDGGGWRGGCNGGKKHSVVPKTRQTRLVGKTVNSEKRRMETLR